MTSPFDYSVSSFLITNVNNTEDSENDYGEEINLNINQEVDDSDDISFPEIINTYALEDDFDEIEPDVINVDEYTPLYSTPDENDSHENSVHLDSDPENDESTQEESNLVKFDSENKPSDDEVVDDHHKCPICLSAWTNAGEHRLCSLKCGHLFGYQCIKHWLNSNGVSAKKCPQCNARASLRHIRFIYANKLTSVDNSEIEQLKKKFDEAMLRCSKISRALFKQKKRTRKYKRLFKQWRK